MGSVGQTEDTARDDASGVSADGLDAEQVRRVLKAPSARRQVSSESAPNGRSLSVGADSEAASGGLVAGPSRYNANNVSTSEENTRSEPVSAVSQQRRTKRFAQRRALWAITVLDRVRKCGRTTASPDGAARIRKTSEGIAYWADFCTCGSIWACPVCSAKIRVVRADEIARAVAKHMTEDGGTAWMVTLTARHKKHHDLEPLFDAVANGWRKLMSGSAWVGDMKRGVRGEKQRLGVRGYIRAMEVTWGHRNGWHPHLHVVLLLDAETGPELAYAMVRWLKVWQAWMVKQGFEAPSDEHAVKWVKVITPHEAGEYLAKTQEGKGIGNEIARGDLKAGRFGTLAPFELLEYFAVTGDTAVIPVWNEYEKGTFRRRAQTWSRGLRAELLPDEAEKTDEEIAAEDQGGETVAILPAESLTAIRRVPGLETRLLDALENGGTAELVNLLTAYHLEYSRPDRS